jgi:hypothetical protein
MNDAVHEFQITVSVVIPWNGDDKCFTWTLQIYLRNSIQHLVVLFGGS